MNLPDADLCNFSLEHLNNLHKQAQGAAENPRMRPLQRTHHGRREDVNVRPVLFDSATWVRGPRCPAPSSVLCGGEMHPNRCRPCPSSSTSCAHTAVPRHYIAGMCQGYHYRSHKYLISGCWLHPAMEANANCEMTFDQ